MAIDPVLPQSVFIVPFADTNRRKIAWWNAFKGPVMDYLHGVEMTARAAWRRRALYPKLPESAWRRHYWWVPGGYDFNYGIGQ